MTEAMKPYLTSAPLTAESRFTRVEAAALWNAVQAYSIQVQEMAKMKPAFAPLLLEQEQQRVATAKRALRKVQAMRRADRAVKKA